MTGLALSERDIEPGWREVEVEGELDLAVVEQLKVALEATNSRYQRVLINLSRCEFLDSTGIALLIQTHASMAKEGRFLAVCCPSDQVERILAVTGVTETNFVFETRDKALASP